MSPSNLILITTYRHRADYTGYNGHPDVRTPNLDALARGGIVLEPATVAGKTPPDSLDALIGSGGLDALRARGYACAYGGPPCPAVAAASSAWTCPWPGEPETPTSYGIWLRAQGLVDSTTGWSCPTAVNVPSAYPSHFGAMRSTLPDAAHVTSWMGDQAVRFVRAALEPFALLLCFPRPGEPYDPTGTRDRAYTQRDLHLPGDCRLPVDPADAARSPRFDFTSMTEPRLRRVLAYYYASVTHVDDQIGRILATLQARGMTQNVIAYTALGGELAGHAGLVGGGDAADYPLLAQVPLVIAGADSLAPPAGEGPTSTKDLLPHLVGLAQGR